MIGHGVFAWTRRVVAACVVAGFTAGFAYAGEYQDDLKARRAALMQSHDAGPIFIAWSAPEKVHSSDV